MKFSGKMCFKIVSKATKNQGSTLSTEDIFFKKPQGGGGGGGGQFDPPPAGILGLTLWILTVDQPVGVVVLISAKHLFLYLVFEIPKESIGFQINSVLQNKKILLRLQ